jgi:hypothetical protein
MHNPDGRVFGPGKVEIIHLYGPTLLIAVILSHHPDLAPDIEKGAISAYRDSEALLQPHDLVDNRDEITLCF